ncbi:MAG: short-chain fatty acid transporter [Polyangiaceae bacterium]|nr:short-chain fatty acid transporter [Polyangiaceae bacterium]
MTWLLARFRDLGRGITVVTERWVPDSWVICMILTSIALVLAVFGAGAGVEQAVLAWGSGVWKLLGLAMQFTIAMVAAHACVSSRPIFRMMDRLADLPDPERPVQAILLAGVFSLVTGYLNWALCLVACALFVPFICRRNPKTDIRVLIAASYLGLGTVWHLGFSGSAPLILATPHNPILEPGTGEPIVSRLYPVTETVFIPFSLIYVAVIGAVSLATAALLHPKENAVSLTPEQIDAILPSPPPEEPEPRTPADRVDRFRGWVLLAVVLFAYPLGHSIYHRGFGASWTINAYNVVFLVAALMLHGRPLSFLRACRQGVDAAWGIILQFPFYAGIFGVIQNTGLGAWIGGKLVQVASTGSYPLVVYFYSGFMNLFVPSAGSKWMIEAPFLIPAGLELDVSVVTTLIAYACGDSTTNLIQPFFAIPILSVTRMRFGDVVGYTFLIAAVCTVVNVITMLLIPASL